MKTNISKPKTLCASLDKIDLAIPGRLRTVTMKCGKDSCPCSSGKKEFFHGPYFFWDRKVNGKPSSLSLPKELVPSFQKWIDNRKKLEALLKKSVSVTRTPSYPYLAPLTILPSTTHPRWIEH